MRAVIIAGSVIVALAVLVGAGRLWAEGKEKQPAKADSPRTRVAIFNLTFVIKKCDKYIKFQEEIKDLIKPFQEREEQLRAQMEELSKKKGISPIVPAKSDDSEEEQKKLQREREDNNTKAKRVLGKKSDEQMAELYKDVLDMAEKCAKAHGFDLVLHYNDAVTREDYFSPANIARKVQTGALMPVYATPGMDISEELVALLNHKR
jgi:Skp family chaperone for outer membrane proteins